MPVLMMTYQRLPKVHVLWTTYWMDTTSQLVQETNIDNTRVGEHLPELSVLKSVRFKKQRAAHKSSLAMAVLPTPGYPLRTTNAPFIPG